MKKPKGKIEEKKQDAVQRGFLFFALLALVIVSGLAMTQSVSAAWPPDAYSVCVGKTAGAACDGASYGRCALASNLFATSQGCLAFPATCVDQGAFTQGLKCVATAGCPDNDRDGYFECQTASITGPAPGAPTGGKYSADSFPDDCDEKDPWSHRLGTRHISKIAVSYDPGYVAQVQTEKKFTPDPKKFNPLFGTLRVSVDLKPVKCIPNPEGLFDTSIVTTDGNGKEIAIPLGAALRVSTPVANFTFTPSGYAPEPFIASVAANRPVQLKFTANYLSHTDTPKYYPLPMTNCAQTHGSGKHKVVYMRDNTSVYGQILDWSTYGVTGFTTIEPLKKYQTEFSHFVDLKKHDYDFASIYSRTIRKLRETSSCGFWNSMYFGVYLDKTVTDGIGNGWVNDQEHMGTAIIQVGGYEKLLSYTFVHEFGHAFANLADEYYDPGRNVVFGNEAEIRESLIPHCSLDPAQDYSAGGKLYGGLNFEHCTIASRDPGFPKRPKIFRPSLDSIMHSSYVPLPGYAQGSNTENYTRFNVVSCAHILRRIKDSPTYKQHFAECAAMSGIVPVGE